MIFVTFAGTCRKSIGFCRKSRKTAGILYIRKMRMRVDHGHMQFKIVTNRDELSFMPLKIMTFVGNTVTKRDKP